MYEILPGTGIDRYLMWASIEEPRRHAELAIRYGHSNVLHNRDDYEDELPDLYWAYVNLIHESIKRCSKASLI